jgi:hypothetical protein
VSLCVFRAPLQHRNKKNKTNKIKVKWKENARVKTQNGSLQVKLGNPLNKDVKFDGLFHEWEMKQLKPVNKDLEISPLRLLKTSDKFTANPNDIKFQMKNKILIIALMAQFIDIQKHALGNKIHRNMFIV